MKPLTTGEIAAARELAQETLIELGKGSPAEKKLADYLLRALDQIASLTQLADPFLRNTGQRFYPDLEREGLGHLWVGPGRNDFAEPIIQAVRKYLAKHEKASARGDAINAIRSKILGQDWGWLEQRWDEGKPPQAGKVPAQPRAAALEEVPPPFGSPAYWDWIERRAGRMPTQQEGGA